MLVLICKLTILSFGFDLKQFLTKITLVLHSDAYNALIKFNLCSCFDSELTPFAGHEVVTAYAKRLGQTSITMRRRWPVP